MNHWDCINSGINCNDVIVIRDTLLCSSVLIVGSLVALIWGKVAKYEKESREVAWWFIAAIIGGGALILIAWIVGKILA